MLHADVAYQADNKGNISITLEAAQGGLAATLHMQKTSDSRLLTGYLPWSQSGFAILAAAFAEFASELSAEVGKLTELEIRIASTSRVSGDKSPLSVVTLSGPIEKYRLIVTGPVLGMVLPMNENVWPENLYATIQCALLHCDPSIGKGQTPSPAITIYSGGAEEPFIFVDDVPYEVWSWFVAQTRLTNPAALMRNGQTALASVYEAFRSGRLS
jgi:hypothetical protein